MSRIPLASIDEQPEAIREWMAHRGNLNVFRLLANAPDVFAGWTQMVDELFASPTFSRRMREVVILRVAHLQGSRYELGQHLGLARTAGLTEQARQLTSARGNLNVYRVLANAEKVVTGWMLAGNAALTSPVLPRRLRELVVLRTAHLMDCPYELGQHRDVARTAGLSSGEINAVTSESDWQQGYFGGVELALLHLTSELLTTRNVAAEVLDQVHEALGAEATVEVLMVINRYAGLALMLNALEVDLDESARLPIPPRQDPRS